MSDTKVKVGGQTLVEDTEPVHHRFVTQHAPGDPTGDVTVCINCDISEDAWMTASLKAGAIVWCPQYHVPGLLMLHAVSTPAITK